MQSKQNFKIENFEAKHLKKSSLSLDNHLKALQTHEDIINDYKKGILREPTLWDKIKKLLHFQ